MVRHQLADEEWDLISDVFPPQRKTGRPQRSRRVIMDGILWILQTGSPWRDLPEEYGAWQSAWRLFDRWSGNGVLEMIAQRFRGRIDIDAELW